MGFVHRFDLIGVTKDLSKLPFPRRFFRILLRLGCPSERLLEGLGNQSQNARPLPWSFFQRSFPSFDRVKIFIRPRNIHAERNKAVRTTVLRRVRTARVYRIPDILQCCRATRRVRLEDGAFRSDAHGPSRMSGSDSTRTPGHRRQACGSVDGTQTHRS